jgi:hypothetical protein
VLTAAINAAPASLQISAEESTKRPSAVARIAQTTSRIARCKKSNNFNNHNGLCRLKTSHCGESNGLVFVTSRVKQDIVHSLVD